MIDIDQRIREALQKEDAELLEHYSSEPSIHEMLIETFHGRWRWLVVVTAVGGTIAALMLMICAYQFFQADTTRAMIGWSTGFIWCALFIMMVKVWYSLELNRNAVTREIKRLELQLAQLNRRVTAARKADEDDT